MLQSARSIAAAFSAFSTKIHIYEKVKGRDVMVSLREITVDNFWECLSLKVKPEQMNFVSSNALSLAQSKYQPECIPLAIYADETMVGFTMYCIEATLQEYYIFRLMIDAEHQGQGYATAAMKLLLERITADKEHDHVFISFEPSNKGAEHLYVKLGFYPTGELNEGEIVLRLDY